MYALTDRFAQLILSIFLIVGGYQFYFWCQTNPLSRRKRQLRMEFDDAIPYRPSWVWSTAFSTIR